MRPIHRTLFAATAIVLTAGPLMPVQAKMAPQITDAAGDARTGKAADLVAVTFEATKKAGKLSLLTITATYNGTPGTGPLTSFNVGGDISGCATFLIYTFWNLELAGPDTRGTISGCGTETDPVTGEPETIVSPAVEVKGNDLVYTMPFSTLPKEIKVGTSFSGLHAWTAPAEPMLGYTPADFLGSDGADDWAESDATYKIK